VQKNLAKITSAKPNSLVRSINRFTRRVRLRKNRAGSAQAYHKSLYASLDARALSAF